MSDDLAEQIRLWQSLSPDQRERLMMNLFPPDDPPFRMESTCTNDYLVPHYFRSDMGRDGWRYSIPMPPGPPEEDWKVLSRGSACTHWFRNCRDWWGSTRLAGAGRVVAKVLQIKAPGEPEG
jgi:hypothetical protein